MFSSYSPQNPNTQMIRNVKTCLLQPPHFTIVEMVTKSNFKFPVIMQRYFKPIQKFKVKPSDIMRRL